MSGWHSPAWARDRDRSELAAIVVAAGPGHPLDEDCTLLTATSLGLAGSFPSPLLEVPLLRDRLRTELDLPGHPQVILGIGRPLDRPPHPTPRRPVAEVLMPASRHQGQRGEWSSSVDGGRMAACWRSRSSRDR